MTESNPSAKAPLDELPRDFDACGTQSPVAGGFQAFLARVRRDHILYSAYWEMTHACNLSCVMCYNVAQPQPELSTDEGLALLEQLAEAGALELTLTGGEILARRDFFTLAERARELGFALYLKTNGTLITESIADRVAALQPVEAHISLLGATDKTFDSVSGQSGTLGRVLAGVRRLQQRDVRVKLNTLLMDLNVHEQGEMVALARELGVSYEQVFKVSPQDDGAAVAGEHQLSRHAMTEVLVVDGAAFEPQPPAEDKRTCGVGLSSCLIDPYGEVYPCVELRISAGNVRHERLADIWRDAPVLRDLRQHHNYRYLPECQSCPLNAYCEGRCAGLAWKECGDMYSGHSLACLHAQARFAQSNPGESVPTTPVQERLRIAQPPANGSRVSAAIQLMDL